ncbi:MAG: hypothetical protein ACI9R3_004492 [Verrucomicrobiales bacterium]|jgi:hypothetical protein
MISKISAFLAIICYSFVGSNAHGAVSFSTANLSDARDSLGAVLPGGTLGLLVVDSANDGFNALGPQSINIGDFIGDVGLIPDGADPDNDVIVGRIAYQDLGFTRVFQAGGIPWNINTSTPTGPSHENDPVAVYWFPGLTMADTSIAANQTYGFNRSADWLTPADGASPGTNPMVAPGNAGLTVVPEPSTAFLLSLAGLLVATRRRRS